MSSTGERLGEAVLARRKELELSQLDVSDAGGPSNTWLTLIENGRLENLSRVTAKKLDRGLQWEPGSARRVWNGEGDPYPLLPGTSPGTSREIREAVERAAALSDDQRAAIIAILDETA